MLILHNPDTVMISFRVEVRKLIFILQFGLFLYVLQTTKTPKINCFVLVFTFLSAERCFTRQLKAPLNIFTSSSCSFPQWDGFKG